MKYFENHLKDTDSAEDIDISVHCDIKIFEWLMNYIHGTANKLETATVIPILISADFLVMRRLIDECILFIGNNLSEIVKIPIDMNCLSQQIVRRVADTLTLEQLDAWKDPRDSLQSKLYSHKLDDLLKLDQNKLNRCIYCNTLFTEEQNEWMVWPKAEVFIDFRGQVLAKHVSDSNWDINEFFNWLRKHGVSWRRIFWKVWARLYSDECTEWQNKFVLADIGNCSYHPEPPNFSFGYNQGTYPCCEEEAIRFSTSIGTKGCTTKRHALKHIKPETIEHKFIDKHYELLREPLKPTSLPRLDQGQEIKSGTDNEDSAKEPTPKYKQMSMLSLLNEFIISKTEKFKKSNCIGCIELGRCCNKCLLEQDEDDDLVENYIVTYPKHLKSNMACKFSYIFN